MGRSLLTQEGVRATYFLQSKHNLLGSKHTCQMQINQYRAHTPKPLPLSGLGSYTQSQQPPAPVTPGQGPANLRRPLCPELTEIIQTANSKSVYPSSPILPAETTVKGLCSRPPSLCLLTHPAASPVWPCVVSPVLPLSWNLQVQ